VGNTGGLRTRSDCALSGNLGGARTDLRRCSRVGWPRTGAIGRSPSETSAGRTFRGLVILSLEPLQSDGSRLRAYAGDDPVNGSDPSGTHVCNANPLTWGGCVENGVGAVASWALDPIKSKVQQTINSVEADENDPSVKATAGTACRSGASGSASLSNTGVVSAIAGDLRLPDYISLEVSDGDFGIVGGVVATVTRFGSIFVGPELGVGFPGISGILETGWIDQLTTPGRNQVNTFVSSNSITLNEYLPAVFGHCRAGGCRSLWERWELGLVGIRYASRNWDR